MGVIQKITFFGYAEAQKGDELFESARETAKVLTKAGYTIVNGGGPGVMKAATIGAHQGGGKAIGVTFYPKDAMQFEGRARDNEIDDEVVTPDYVSRTLKLLELGQVYIVFNGGTGTLSEFGMVWGVARLYFGHHKPVILYGEFWEEVVNVIAHHMHLRPWDRSIVTVVRSPGEALRAVEAIDRKVTQEEPGGEKASGPFTI